MKNIHVKLVVVVVMLYCMMHLNPEKSQTFWCCCDFVRD